MWERLAKARYGGVSFIGRGTPVRKHLIALLLLFCPLSGACAHEVSLSELVLMSPDDRYKYYVDSVHFFTGEVRKTNVFLSFRMTHYFSLSELEPNEETRYQMFVSIARDMVNNGSGDGMTGDGLIEHMSQDKFGRFFGIAIAASDDAERAKAKDDAVISRSGASDDKLIPIRLLTSTGEQISSARRVMIYEESVRAALDELKSSHPELVDSFSDMYYEPKKVYDDFPVGYKAYQDRIDKLANGKSGLQLTSLAIVETIGRFWYSITQANSQKGRSSGH